MQFLTLIALCGVLNSAALATPVGDLKSPSTDSSPGLLGGVNEQANNANATEASHRPATISFNFYMCCLYDDVSAPLPDYAPPYACIYGPSSGKCPQGASSSFQKTWLCSYEQGLLTGDVECSYKA